MVFHEDGADMTLKISPGFSASRMKGQVSMFQAAALIIILFVVGMFIFSIAAKLMGIPVHIPPFS